MSYEYVACNLCGRDEPAPWGSKDGLQIVQCSHCELVYTNPRPDSKELAKYYGTTYFEEGNYLADQQRRAMYEIDIRQMARIIKMSGRFLDVGCAHGRFLTLLPDSFEKHGVEFSVEAAEIGRSTFGLNIKTSQLSEADYPNEFFDVVHMRGVVEHLQDPFADLQAARKILRTGGWLVVSTTPNIVGPVGRLFRERFRLVIPNEHIYYFSPRTLSRLLRRAAFKPLRIVYPYWGTPYANPFVDPWRFVANYFTGSPAPAFWRSVMTIYATTDQVR